MKLTSSTSLNACLDGIIAHRSREAYAILGQGMYLLRAASLFSIPAEGRGQGRKSIATVAIDLTEENPGFLQWLLENVTGPESRMGLSQRTCYNYMRAAAAMGLSSTSTEDDLTALQEANAMAERRLSDLYKPALEEGSRNPGGPPPEAPGGPEQLWLAFEVDLSEQFAPESLQVKALYQLPETKRDAIERQLRQALDVVREVNASLKSGGARK